MLIISHWGSWGTMGGPLGFQGAPEPWRRAYSSDLDDQPTQIYTSASNSCLLGRDFSHWRQTYYLVPVVLGKSID